MLFLLAVLGFYIVGELTHMRSMCVGVAETGVEHCSPAKILKVTFFIVLLHDQKYQKSFKRIFHPLKKHPPRARVSRKSHAWQVRAARDKVKVGSFALSTASSIPRVRTYHTRQPSRFVHALSARPLKVQGGREFGLCADGSNY